MHVTRISLLDFRNYPEVELAMRPGVTVFLGHNGQGKTNLVEAIGYLASLGSHRVSTDGPLVRSGASRAIVRGEVVHAGRQALIELEITPGKSNRARLNRAPVSRPRDVLGLLRTVLFAPEDLTLVKGDPDARRRFLDELLVARAPRYAGVRQDYERVLKQRNTLLKTAGASRSTPSASQLATLAAWDDQLAQLGAELVAGRLALTRSLQPLVAAAYRQLAGTDTGDRAARLDYRCSADLTEVGLPAPAAATDGAAADVDSGEAEGAGSAGANVDAGANGSGDGADPEAASTVGDDPSSAAAIPVDRLARALLASLHVKREDELRRGTCLVGPHRDDLLLRLGEFPAKGYASHGESWSFALALRLAAYDLLTEDGGEPVLILDDVFAELDTRRRERLAARIAHADQVLVTAAVGEDVPDQLATGRYVMFSVSDGTVTDTTPERVGAEGSADLVAGTTSAGTGAPSTEDDGRAATPAPDRNTGPTQNPGPVRATGPVRTVAGATSGPHAVEAEVPDEPMSTGSGERTGDEVVDGVVE